MPPDNALKPAREWFRDRCLVHMIGESDVDALAALLARHAAEAVAEAAPGIERKARIDALEWTVEQEERMDYFSAIPTAAIEAELARLRAEGGSDAAE